ncbi:hydroxyacid dehydrogenase [archaeon]|nr:hydroxyacid dehydrogenase [archaeon]|tara:strand:+ start:143 stop:1147 length:1005 start_codon:yes stop_codon:yes gene_type:complete
MKKIAFFEIKKWEEQYLKERLKNFELKFFEDGLTKKNIDKVKDFDAVSVFIYSKIDKELLERFSNLKLIVTRSTGFDHIELEGCKKGKITICNVPHYGENTVAEHTFALILALSRKIYESYEKVKKGNFSLEGLTGFDLKDKTIGIVGMGSIGRYVARIAKGFEMNILAYDVTKDLKFAKRFGLKYVGLNDLLKNSDIISLHVPYNKKTHHLINKNNLKLIKKGSILINTARGGIVETDTLLRGLSKRIFSGVGLDVLEEECFIKEEKQLLAKQFPKKYDLAVVLKNHILLTHENCIITPHNAFNSKEALIRILDTTILNIKFFFKGKKENIVK